jgi:hypothetical protein
VMVTTSGRANAAGVTIFLARDSAREILA